MLLLEKIHLVIGECDVMFFLWRDQCIHFLCFLCLEGHQVMTYNINKYRIGGYEI